jgi:uridylate kinase
MAELKYKRILLKLSGEALMGSLSNGIDPKIADFIAEDIKEIKALGAEVAIMVGGGNIYRGAQNFERDGIKEETAHYMGILATCMNGLALPDLFNSRELETKALSALGPVCKMGGYSIPRAKKILEDNFVLVLAGATGEPFCTSDSGASLRAKELGADVIFKASKVDGAYDSDPALNPDAQKFSSLSFDETLKRDLKVMDREAFLMCKEAQIPIIVFKMEKGNIKKVAIGEKVGTIIQ